MDFRKNILMMGSVLLCLNLVAMEQQREKAKRPVRETKERRNVRPRVLPATELLASTYAEEDQDSRSPAPVQKTDAFETQAQKLHGIQSDKEIKLHYEELFKICYQHTDQIAAIILQKFQEMESRLSTLEQQVAQLLLVQAKLQRNHVSEPDKQSSSPVKLANPQSEATDQDSEKTVSHLVSGNSRVSLLKKCLEDARTPRSPTKSQQLVTRIVRHKEKGDPLPKS